MRYCIAITRAGLEESHPYLLKEFDTVFLNATDAGNQAIRDHFGDCVRLNEYGLLMGPFLREVAYAASRSRFSSERALLAETIKAIMAHMLAFQQPLFHIPEAAWSYQGPCSSYAFILVSKPPDIRPGIEAYLRRAQGAVQKGIERLYVIGRYEERDFVHTVTKAFLSIRELKGLEIFPLVRDYRGDPSGVGALLGLDQLLAKLTQRPVDSMAIQVAGTSTDGELEPVDESKKLEIAAQHDLAKITEDLIVQLSDYNGAWISLAEFGGALRSQVPEFTPQRYGGRNLVSVLKKLESLEFDERGAGPAKAVYVRMRTEINSAAKHAAPGGDRADYARIVQIVKEHTYTAEGGWIFLGQLGHLLKTQFPDFDYSKDGASSLHEVVSRIPALELEERGEHHSKTYVRVRR